MRKLRKYTAAEYSSASGSVVNPSVVLVDGDVKLGGNIAISDETNKPLMDALRNKGVIASNKTYLTVDEAGQITTLPNDFISGNTSIVSLEELRFFTGLTSIGSYSIRGAGASNDKLVKWALPPTITSLGSSALQSRPFVKKIVIPDKSKYGNGVTSLPDKCIRQNYSLRLLVLPSTLQSIANNNFNRLGWRGSNFVVNSITFIGDTPCALTLICKAIVPPTVNSTDNSFLTYGSYDCTGSFDLKIYVPDESVNAYKGATWWTRYSNYILPLSSCNLSFYGFFEDDFEQKLPSGYKELDYVKNGTTGNVLDTGVDFAYNMSFSTKLRLPEVPSTNSYLVGCYSSDMIRSLLTRTDNVLATHVFVNNDSPSAGAFGLGAPDTNKHFYKLTTRLNSDSLNPQVVKDIATYNSTQVLYTSENTPRVYMYGAGVDSALKATIPVEIYSLTIYNADGSMAADFVPCRQISTNNVGFFDIITRRFIMGAFLVGSDE